MQDLIPNILRGSVTSIMNVLLLFTLTKSKYGRSSTAIVAILVFVINIVSTFWFYLYGDLTALSRFNIVMFIVIGLCLQPLSKANFMQWVFNFLTTINIMMIIIACSLYLGKLFPHPQYANILLRLGMYVLVMYMFQQFLLPVYRSVVSHWPIFSLLIICIFLNLSYYFYATTDIQNTLLTARWPLMFLITLSVAAYGTVFYSLKRFTAIHALETENLKMHHDSVLLSHAASTMAEKLHLMDKQSYEHTIVSHDRRHFNNMLLRLLEHGEVEEAMSCLHKQNAVKPQGSRHYCENKAINAATSYYVAMAEKKSIRVNVSITLPEKLEVDSMELALVVSNLFENAIHGVLLLPEGQERYINITCIVVGRLILEITNPCIKTVALDSDGLPFSSQSEHGIGTRSIVAFSAKHQAELLYDVHDGLFNVRLLI